MATYRRVTKLTSAGQSEIWIAKNTETSQEFVMKRLLPAPQLQDPDAELRRFYREVRCQSSLQHDGIMPIIGWNFSASPPWYVMPRATHNLAEVIEQHPDGLDEEEAAAIILDVAAAVEYAHQEGVLHRDLKPANVLYFDERWVVADFGLCRDLNTDSTTITKTNTIVGTVAYLAPEQFDDAHDSGVEADVFSLGRMLYHVLTGRVPFPYTRLELLPDKFSYLVARALSERPSDRYPSVAEFSRELKMLITRDDSLMAPSERGKALLSKALGKKRGAVRELLELLLSNASDEAFYTDFVPGLPSPALSAMQRESPDGFERVVRTFDAYSEGGHPFSYTDGIANFFKTVFDIATQPLLKQQALRRIMIVGYEHNRFYVREVFARLVGGLRDPQDILLAASVLRENTEAAAWCAEELKSRSVPPAIRDLLAET